MSRKKISLIVVLLFIITIFIYGLYWFRSHGFSARAQPSKLEAYFARNARRIATPADAVSLKNPFSATEASMKEAAEHFEAHCSVCHGIDGRGQTTIGRNLYPKSPDMTLAETQKLTDGELFYIISNGVRFTGMPAWGDEDSPESIWALVAYIRRLPKLTPEELKRMQEPETTVPVESKKEKTKPHSDPSGAKPHKH